MSSSTDILDSLLPLLHPEGRELHLNAAIVEVAEPAQLAELAPIHAFAGSCWRAFSDTRCPGRSRHGGEIEAAFLAAGTLPRCSQRMGNENSATVLESSLPVKIDLNLYGSLELKRAARFWAGKEAGSFNKEKCIAALTRTMADGDTARRVLAGLTEQERQFSASSRVTARRCPAACWLPRYTPAGSSAATQKPIL